MVLVQQNQSQTSIPDTFYTDPQGIPIDPALFGVPQLEQPSQGAIYPNRDQGFLKWLFSFTAESLGPLEHNWLGHVLNKNGEWTSNPDPTYVPIMSKKGTDWAISLLKSYFNPVFFVTNIDYRVYNSHMRKISRVVLYNLYTRYEEFGLKTTDITNIKEQIISKIGAILAGALSDGYRIFLSTQHQHIEHEQISTMQQPTQPGIFGKINEKVFGGQQGQRGQ